MAKNVLQSTILSGAGTVVITPGAQIEVRNPGGLLVPLWLDRDGTQPTPNPTTADSDGFFRVYLNSGRYHITVRSGSESHEWRDVLLGSAAGYDVTTSPTDTTPGRVLTAGSLGLGKPTADPAAPIAGSLLSGAMLAAGAIVEMGENANGSYWRWESGLQVCARSISLGPVLVGDGTASNPWRTLDFSLQLPAAFVGDPVLTATAERYEPIGPESVVGAYLRKLSDHWLIQAWAASSAGSDVVAYVTAIGRWK